MDFEKLKSTAYNCKVAVLFSDNTREFIDEYIHIFTIYMPLTTDIFPKIRMKLSIEPTIAIRMQNDENFKISLSIKRRYVEEAESYLYDDELDTILIPLSRTTTPLDITDSVIINDENSNKTKYQYESFEMILMTEECYNVNKQLTSGVFHNTNVLNVLGSLTQGIGSNILMEQPDNDKVYEQIPLLPYNAFINIQYLNEVYGIYKTGFKMFYGFNNFFVTSKKFYDPKNGSVNIYVRFPSSKKAEAYYTIGSYRHGNDVIINTSIHNIGVSDTSYMNEVIGNNNLYFSTIDNDLRKVSKESNNTKKNKTKLYVNKFNNKMKEEELTNINSREIIQLAFSNIELNVNDCNKKFKFFFDSSYYSDRLNGDYTLGDIAFSFKRGSSSVYSMTGIATFRKL